MRKKRREKFAKKKEKNILMSTAINTLAQLLRPVILIQKIVRDLLEIRQMAVQQRAPDGQEVRVPRVVDLDDAPGILPRADAAAADLDDLLAADDGEGHQAAQLAVLLHRVFVIFFDVVGEIVHGDPVMLDVLHDELLGLGQLRRGEGVGFSDDGDHVGHGGEAAHQFDVEFAEAGESV